MTVGRKQRSHHRDQLVCRDVGQGDDAYDDFTIFSSGAADVDGTGFGLGFLNRQHGDDSVGGAHCGEAMNFKHG